MSPYHHILFATDLSQLNKDMREKVHTLASLFRARLSVVYVATNLDAISRSHSLSLGLQEEIEAQAKASLKEFCQPLEVAADDQIIKIGQPAKEVLNTVKETSCDLLVLGRYGEGGIIHLLGSVSHRLLNSAPCELMLIN